MAGAIRSSAKDEIRQRINLLDIVSGHVSLKKAGRQYKGLCPFHQEKTPSFHVDPDKGLWYCFGCGQGGDAFDFVMRVAGVSFPEALQELAAKAGVALEQTQEDRRDRTEREELLRVLDAAARFFREQLSGPRGEIARQYLVRRGVSPEIAEAFGLGYAPAEWEALHQALHGEGFPTDGLLRAGLIQPRPSGSGHYDMFRHRLIFPINDLQGRVVGFGGRALDEATPKYLNSRESPVFEKRHLLYGLPQARDAVRDTGEALVVEGYMDVLACHQFGFSTAVASLGTALTQDHVLLLKRFASRAVLVYDPDAAGVLAAERGLALFEEAEMPARVAVLPAGRDPDTLLRTEGADRFRTILQNGLSMFEFRVQQALTRHDVQTVEGRVALADEMLNVVGAASNPIRQSEYVRMLAERFDLAEDALRQRLASLRRPGLKPAPEPALSPGGERRARRSAEELLVRLMAQVPEVRKIVSAELSVEHFQDPLHRRLVEVLMIEDAPGEGLRGGLDEEAAGLLTRLLFEPLPVMENQQDKVLAGAIRFLKEEAPLGLQRRRVQQAIAAAQAAGDTEQLLRLQREYMELVDARRAGPAPGAEAPWTDEESLEGQ